MKKRRDKKNRILHNGEFQLADRRYRFKYLDVNDEEKYVYNWRLDCNDPTPKGKRRDLSLREKEYNHFCKYYDALYILFNTGLRISEFCGLTMKDIDFEEKRINVNHQL